MSDIPSEPRCPGCGEPAMDGRVTCGRSKCGPEGKWASQAELLDAMREMGLEEAYDPLTGWKD